MIEGTISEEGVPEIELAVAGQSWTAIIDTGFNGDLELPVEFGDLLQAEYVGTVESTLAAGQIIEEDVYEVEFPFDGRTITSQATFVAQSHILLGTHLLREYHLSIDFPARELRLERAVE